MFWIISVVSALIHESVWINRYCRGPPQRYRTYSAESPSSLYQTSLDEGMAPPMCSNNPMLITYGCCWESYDTEQTEGYTSISYVDTEQVPHPLSADANGYTYCVLEHEGQTKGYLAYSGCQDGIQCVSNGRTFFYNTSDCSGAPLFQHDLATPVQITLHDTLYLAKRETIRDATVTFSWRAVVQMSRIVPTFDNPIDYLATISLVVCYIQALGMLLYYAYSVWKGNKEAIGYVVTQLIWFMYLGLQAYFWCVVFTDNSWMLVGQFRGMFGAFLTLLSVFWTLRTILRFLRVQKGWVSIGSYVLMALFHFSVAGAQYAYYWHNVEETTEAVSNWLYAAPFWKLFVFLFNIVPPVLITFKICALHNMTAQQTGEEKLGVLQYILKHRSGLFFTLIAQWINTILFTICTVVRGYTELLRTDVQFHSFALIIDLLHMNHESLNILIAEGVAGLVQSLVSNSRKAVSSHGKSTTSASMVQRSRSYSTSHHQHQKQ
jgi:hypothetical protein